MTPIEFLTARYDEREAIARAAIGTAAFQTQTGRWSFEKVPDQHAGTVPIVFAITDGGGSTQAADLSTAWEADERGAHIAANDPAYVLADIATKRAILRQYAAAVENEARWRQALSVSVPGESFASSLALVDGARNVVGVLRPVVWALCRPFADHPAYNPGWSA